MNPPKGLNMQGKLSGQVLLATLSVVGTRAMQVYTSAQFARARVRNHALHFLATSYVPLCHPIAGNSCVLSTGNV